MCCLNLRKGGNLVMKGLYGNMEKDYFNLFRIYFDSFLRVKPKASRSRSSELYYVGKGFKISNVLDLLKIVELKK